MSLFAFLLFVFEFFLRTYGYQPGVICPLDDARINMDSIYLREDYIADEYGITKYSPEAREYVAVGIVDYRSNLIEKFNNAALIIPSFNNLNENRLSNSFSKFINSGILVFCFNN